jgi:hypothetical protein
VAVAMVTKVPFFLIHSTTFGDLIIVKKKRRIEIRHPAEVRGDVIIIIITRIAIVK